MTDQQPSHTDVPMRRIGLAVVFAVSLILVPLTAPAQAGRVYRIGVLVVPEGFQSNVDAFRDGLRDLGYTEGKNVIIEYREAGGRYERLHELAADLLRLNPEAIVTSGVPGIRAVERLSKTIPIVMTTVGDAVAGDEWATMNVSADGSYKASATSTTTVGKFYLEAGKLRYRSRRTTPAAMPTAEVFETASVSEDQGKTILTLMPEDPNYLGRAEYEKVK